MTFKIITADERLARPSKINIALFGPSGVGKTFQARTLDPEKTLFVDLEAGTLALQDWRGDVLDVRAMAVSLGLDPWLLCRAIACVLCGFDPADHSGAYSKAAWEQYTKAIPPEMFAKYDAVYID
jgi:hypothetical protein